MEGISVALGGWSCFCSDCCNGCDIIEGTRLLARDDGKELWEGSHGDDKDDWESTRSALQTWRSNCGRRDVIHNIIEELTGLEIVGDYNNSSNGQQERSLLGICPAHSSKESQSSWDGRKTHQEYFISASYLNHGAYTYKCKRRWSWPRDQWKYNREASLMGERKEVMKFWQRPWRWFRSNVRSVELVVVVVAFAGNGDTLLSGWLLLLHRNLYVNDFLCCCRSMGN